MAETPPPNRRNSEIDLDLGFGNVVSSQSRRRLLNRDGTFNVRRTGLGFLESLSVYHFLLEISWPRFLGLACVWYILVNALFAAIYVALGPGALDGVEATSALGSFGEAFFFSVYTLATIGYGNVTPAVWPADVVATLESLAGLLTFGLAAGIMFARFARPNARIIFSRNALIAPYHEGCRLRVQDREQPQEPDHRAVREGHPLEAHTRRPQPNLPGAPPGTAEGGDLPAGLDHRPPHRRVQPALGTDGRGSGAVRGRVSRSPDGLRRDVLPDRARPFLLSCSRSDVRRPLRRHVRPRRKRRRAEGGLGTDPRRGTGATLWGAGRLEGALPSWQTRVRVPVLPGFPTRRSGANVDQAHTEPSAVLSAPDEQAETP